MLFHPQIPKPFHNPPQIMAGSVLAIPMNLVPVCVAVRVIIAVKKLHGQKELGEVYSSLSRGIRAGADTEARKSTAH